MSRLRSPWERARSILAIGLIWALILVSAFVYYVCKGADEMKTIRQNHYHLLD